MPVPVACSCGKQLRVSDEYRGKRIKCPECREGITVPARDTPARAIAGDGMVRFTCECGKQLQAKSEFAGKMTRCPDCGEKQEIPELEESGVRAKKNGIQSGPSRGKKIVHDELEEVEDDRPRRRPRDDDEDSDPDRTRSIQREPSRGKKAALSRLDDDEDFEDDKPRKKGKKNRRKNSSSMPLIIGLILGAVFLLGGGGFAAYWFIFSGGAAKADEMAFIPADAEGLMSFRVSELFKVNGFRDGFMRGTGANNFVDEMAGSMGVTTNDIDRWTMVFQNLNQKPPVVWIVASTTKPYDQKKVLDALKNNRKVVHEGRTFYVGQSNSLMGMPIPGMAPGMGPGMGGPIKQTNEDAWYFARKNVIVRAPGENAMKQALAAAARKSTTGQLADAIRQMQSRHFFVAFNLPPESQRQLKDAAKMAQGVNVGPLAELNALTFGMDVNNNNLVMDVALKYPDDKRAGEAKTAINGLLDMAGLGLMGGNDPMTNAAREVLKSVKVNQKGKDVTVNLSVASKTFEAFGNPGGMGGPPFGPPGLPKKR